jgi:hypothetical protein
VQGLLKAVKVLGGASVWSAPQACGSRRIRLASLTSVTARV